MKLAPMIASYFCFCQVPYKIASNDPVVSFAARALAPGTQWRKRLKRHWAFNSISGLGWVSRSRKLFSDAGLPACREFNGAPELRRLHRRVYERFYEAEMCRMRSYRCCGSRCVAAWRDIKTPMTPRGLPGILLCKAMVVSGLLMGFSGLKNK